MKATVTIAIDTDSLQSLSDQYLAATWYVVQMNPAPLGDQAASRLAAAMTKEICRRFLERTPPLMNAHSPGDAEWHALMVEKGRLPPLASPTDAPAEVPHG